MPIAISGKQLEGLLSVLKGADSVELKLTIPADLRGRVLDGLGVDPLDARIRQVFFFDMPDLRLNRAGVVVRARRIQDAAGDTTVKLRPVVPRSCRSPYAATRRSRSRSTRSPGGYVCSGSLKGVATNEEVHDAAAGRAPP
jgi:hypothetical protein